MSQATQHVWESLRTDESRKVEEHLRQAGFGEVDAYRYNSASLRVRVVDPRFEGLSHMERVGLLDPFLDQLPESTQADLITIFTFTPDELADPSSFRGFHRNDEFLDPGPSML